MFLGELGDGFGRAHAGDDVFALGVDEEFTVEFLDAIGGIAGERHAGAGGFAGVAIHHGLHVDGGAPLGGDVVFAAINDGPVVHPGTEHGAGGAPELLPRILREFLAGALLDQNLEAGDKFLEVIHGERGVFDIRVITFVLEAVDDGFKGVVIFIRRASARRAPRRRTSGRSGGSSPRQNAHSWWPRRARGRSGR